MNVDLATAAGGRALILVEGASDRAALETLAARRGRALGAEGISIVHMGGATNIGHFLGWLRQRQPDVLLAGLCDAAEESYFGRALEQAGLGSDLTRARMEQLGFYVCTEDLEDELIRAVGPAAVEDVIRSQREIRPFRTFQKQPAHQGESLADQMHRFMGTHSGRKSQYARALVEAVELTRVPRPLDQVLAHV
jgi:hypothetical protein